MHPGGGGGMHPSSLKKEGKYWEALQESWTYVSDGRGALFHSADEDSKILHIKGPDEILSELCSYRVLTTSTLSEYQMKNAALIMKDN